MTVYRYISLSIFFFASIFFLSGRVSVCLCMPHECVVMIEILISFISRYLQICFKKSIEVFSYRCIHCKIHNHRPEDNLTIRTLMLSHKRSQMYCTTGIFQKISFFLVLELFVEYHIDHKNSKGGVKRNRYLSRNLEPKTST